MTNDMNARQRALDQFCDEMDEVIYIMGEEGWTYDDALDHLLGEYDEYWRALFKEELENEDLTAK